MSKLITVSENLLEDILPHVKNTSFSLIYQNSPVPYGAGHKKPWIYQKELLVAQDEAKKNKRGIWSK